MSPLLNTIGAGSNKGFGFGAGGDGPTPIAIFQDNATATPTELLSLYTDYDIVSSIYMANGNQTNSEFNTTGLTTTAPYGRVAEQIIPTTSAITKYGFWDTSLSINNPHYLIAYGKVAGTSNYNRLFAFALESGFPTNWYEYIGLDSATSGDASTNILSDILMY